MLTPSETGRRLAAARVLAGYDSRIDFAKDLNLARFGEGPIRDVERGNRTLERHELAAVAEFCGLPRSFFTADRDELGPVEAPDLSDEMIDRLDRIEAALNALGEDPGEPQ